MKTALLALLLSTSWLIAQPFRLHDPAFLESSSPLRRGLVGYWQLEESSGLRYDRSITGQHLGSTNTVTQGTGKIGFCGSFLVTSSNLLGGFTNNYVTTAFTLSAWVKFFSTNGNMTIVSKYDTGFAGRQFQVAYDLTVERLKFTLSTNGVGADSVTANTFGSVGTNVWRHILIQYATNTIAFYVNNNSGDTATAVNPMWLTNAQFAIGGRFTAGAVTATFNGLIDEVGLWNRWLSSAERTQIFNQTNGTTFPRFAFNNNVLDWGGSGLTGTYPLIGVTSNYTVISPDGNTPVEGSLVTHRYRHHTRILNNGSGKTYVAFSSGGSNEDASGQQVAMCVSADKGLTWSAPILVVPSQSTFSGTGATYETGKRIAYPRNFQTVTGTNYIICAVEETQTNTTLIGLALLARAINADNTLGTLYRISNASYAAIDGAATVTYDSGFAGALYDYSKLYGKWGGSSPTQPPSDWIGWVTENALDFTEPSTTVINPFVMLRVWRQNTTAVQRLYQALSYNGGATFGPITITPIPDCPTSTTVGTLTNGDIFLVGNPVSIVNALRDPLYLAIYNPSMLLKSLNAIRQGLSETPVYAGTSKIGGASYADAVQVGNYLYVSYSVHKEDIGFSRVLIPGLADNNND